MATKVIENLTDDLNPEVTEDVQTVTFYDPATGVQREIELGDENRAALESILNEFSLYVDASRAVEVAPKRAAAHVKGKQAEIRAWAQANGYKIGDRGRIKADIVEAFHAAQDAKANPDSDAVASGDEPVKLAETSNEAPELEDAPQAEVESPQNDYRPANDAELQEMLLNMAREGREPTADDLRMGDSK